jgi:hypothetical protein
MNAYRERIAERNLRRRQLTRMGISKSARATCAKAPGGPMMTTVAPRRHNGPSLEIAQDAVHSVHPEVRGRGILDRQSGCLGQLDCAECLDRRRFIALRQPTSGITTICYAGFC